MSSFARSELSSMLDKAAALDARLLVLAAPCAAVTYLVFLALYRCFFHPLAAYPGPMLASLSDWWATYHAARGDLARTLLELHEKHGEFVRFGPQRISCNQLEALEPLYGNKANVKKSVFYKAYPADPKFPSTHTAIDRPVHARKRRIIAQGFSTKSLKLLEPHILDSSNVLIEKLGQPGTSSADGWSEPKDMSRWASLFTNDVMGAATFSKRFGLMENPENQWFPDAVVKANRHKYFTAFMPWLASSGLDSYLARDWTAKRNRVQAFAVRQLQERFAKKDDGSLHDFFSFILGAKDPETGESFSVAELGSESSLLINAGGDTTSTSLAAILYFLTKDTESLAKVTEEVRSQFDNLDAIRPGPSLASCSFMKACIDESMRLAPGVPSPLLREALPGGVSIKGHFFPEGTDLGVAAGVIHRNNQYFAEANEFRPSRWIARDDSRGEEERLQTAHTAFIPFSVGPRACVGRPLAISELSVGLARTVWALDLKRLPGDTTGAAKDGTYELLDCFIAEKHGPMVQFRRR